MSKEAFSNIEKSEGEENLPNKLLSEQLDTMKRKYTKSGVLTFKEETERMQYTADIGIVTGALTGALSILEANKEEQKKLLQNLKDTLRTLEDVMPDNAKVGKKSYEEIMERLDKYLYQ